MKQIPKEVEERLNKGRPLYYDMDGKPLGLIEWAEKFERMATKERQVASTRKLFGQVWVSTVWLGIDHDFSWAYWEKGPNPRPLIFETMLFVRGRGGFMRRWSTKAEAIAGHKALVRELRNPITLIKKWWEYR